MCWRRPPLDRKAWIFTYGAGVSLIGIFVQAPLISNNGRDAFNDTAAGSFGALWGGLHAGYDHLLLPHVLLGAEGDISFPDFLEDGLLGSSATLSEKLDFVSTLRARAGYTDGRWLVYATGGFAWGQARYAESPADGAVNSLLRERIGWTVGAGAELMLAPGWSLRLEYLFDHLGPASGDFSSGARVASAPVDLNEVRLGVSWHPGVPSNPSTTAPTVGDAVARWLADTRHWNVHGQLTYVEQGYPAFHSAYAGANSLPAGGEVANTATVTAFLGVHLWPGAELYFNPELDQGTGLGNTLGLAGFPNGEAEKAGHPVPRFNYDRLFVRQTFGLGGRQEAVADGPNQLTTTRDLSRVTVTLGKLSTGDLFDVNAYAADPRTQFLNWNIFGGGSYDWTMDQPGWTWGAAVELNEPDWAVRVGYFLVPTTSNANTFDLNIPSRGEYAAELELPYARDSHPGKLRLFAWVNRAVMGSYAAALAMPATTPGYPDLTQTREVRTNYGFVANLEQELTSDLGLFSRGSWSPGLLEIIGWTDCDWSASLGAVLKGTRWRRPDDKLGLATVIEGLSPEAQAYFDAGGLGILIGDGHLDYRPEQVVEAYYACNVLQWLTITLDYQLVANPAYNSDRGPVSIFAARIHAEF